MPVDIDLHGPGATEALARDIARNLGAGDCLLLAGPVGAGKSLFARTIIRHFCGEQTEIPSPSFTLVQTYDCAGLEIWHVDLYRLTSAEAAEELGLADAFDTALTLIEWPDRLGSRRPARHLAVTLTPDPEDEDRRVATLKPSGNWPWLKSALSAGSWT